MENSNTPEAVSHWDAEAREWRKMGAVAFVGAAALAFSGRSTSALKVAFVGGGMLAISEVERRVGRHIDRHLEN